MAMRAVGRDLLCLSLLPEIGERRLQRLRAQARRAGLGLGELLELPSCVLRDRFALPDRALSALRTRRAELGERCERLCRELDNWRIGIAEPGDEGYPGRWNAQLPDPPPITYLLGNPALLARPTIAIVSSRFPGSDAIEGTLRAVQQAALEGWTVWTSGMKTSYRVAAVATRSNGASRVIVLDRGILTVTRESRLRDGFGFGPARLPLDLEQTLILSSFRPTDHAVPRNGPRRDRLVAAGADIVFAASARPGGQMERVCLEAVDRGQCVLCWQAGNRALVANGALPVDVADIERGLLRYLP